MKARNEITLRKATPTGGFFNGGCGTITINLDEGTYRHHEVCNGRTFTVAPSELKARLESLKRQGWSE